MHHGDTASIYSWELYRLQTLKSTIINSTGMGRVYMQIGAATPGIEGIKKTLKKNEPSNKMIFTVVRDKDTPDKAIGLEQTFEE